MTTKRSSVVADQTKDLETLAESLYQLLSGELKVGINLLSVGNALRRQGAQKQWVIDGLARWIDENEEALPLLAASLSHEAMVKLKDLSERRKAEQPQE